jgi:hypothetical protein
MVRYYIKKHYKTPEEYPGDEGIHFTRRAYSVAERFAACDGFLLYEAGGRERTGLAGSKCVYGYGTVLEGPMEAGEIRVVGDKEYPYVVRVCVEKRLHDKTRGIPLRLMRELYGVQIRPTLGGTLEVSGEAFREMKAQLDRLCEDELWERDA